MSYYKDLRTISINEYKELLMTMELIKSRQVLRDDIDRQFSIIQNQGIENIEQLSNALKSKKNLEEFSKNSGIDINYLTVLNREINSLQPKANRFSDLPCLDEVVVSKLEAAGYKDTYRIYDQIVDAEKRHSIAYTLDIQSDTMDIIAKYVDISRIRWVNHTFAYMLLMVNYDCVEKIARADANKLYNDIKTKNDEEHLYKGNVGLNDMKILIQWAEWVQENLE